MLNIDWQAPWLQDLRATGLPVQQCVVGGSSVCQALNVALAAARAGMHFVQQSDLPSGQAYEQFIFETNTVPTRDNLHDFFNGLCWITFPQIKKKLNQLQAAEIAKAGVQPLRGAVRDALTVFDENAAFLIAPQPLWNALLARDWHMLFITLRPLWKDAQLILFGHALLEKLVCPRKAITAHVYRAQSAMNSIANMKELDAWIAADLGAAGLATKPFTPLPVLGVPGWWADNENFSFYDDSSVFRQPKPATAAAKPLTKDLI